MDNDFNSAQALGHIFDTVKAVNKIAQHLPPIPSQQTLDRLRQAGATLKQLGDLLGILQQDPVAYLTAKQEKILSAIDLSPQQIEALIAERNKARDEKDWTRADEIRDRLLSRNIEIKDAAGGTTWQVKI